MDKFNVFKGPFGSSIHVIKRSWILCKKQLDLQKLSNWTLPEYNRGTIMNIKIIHIHDREKYMNDMRLGYSLTNVMHEYLCHIYIELHPFTLDSND